MTDGKIKAKEKRNGRKITKDLRVYVSNRSKILKYIYIIYIASKARGLYLMLD